ncbi:hypothetical protein M408DRAFT_27944 [Serendipita vermifera MAFF 305830]|uniref:F-box domain-containing protein n=1 Tax=Serendipita vermifera MAFF 305830 TaxID=933852 RepID=A0A0C2X1L0_SERVB|nr:hypothetical protein M408DRAFT_27944 [Serendipita vermifera MAFF 305830]
MSQGPQLSVELWQWILRYAISIPEFLDPVTFDGVFLGALYVDRLATRSDETAYWITERHRRSFQLVCKSWAAYMQMYEHRFVRMVDIWHEKISPASLKHAVRVSFGRYDCECREYCAPALAEMKYSPTGVLPHRSYKDKFFGNVCSRILGSVGPLRKLEIGDVMREPFDIADILTHSQNFKQIKALLGIYHTTLYMSRNQNPSLLLEILPKLRYHYGCNLRNISEIERDASSHYAPPGKELIRPTMRVFQNMVYLSLGFLSYGENDSSYTLDFPFLRHLQIQYNSAGVNLNRLMQEITLPILQNSRGNIQSLYIAKWFFIPPPPVDIWDLCPKLQRFGCSRLLTLPPPSSHPVHTFISTYTLDESKEMDVCLWPNLRTIIADRNWTDRHPEQPVSDQWRQKAAERGIRIEDRNGLTWEEHLISTASAQ